MGAVSGGVGAEGMAITEEKALSGFRGRSKHS